MDFLKRIFTMGSLKNTYFFLTGSGVVVFMFYCVRIGFLRTGLSLSGVIFFLMVITSFSLILAFFLVCWYSMGVVSSYLLMKMAFRILQVEKVKKTIGEERLYRIKGTYRMARLLKIYDPLFAHCLSSLIGGVLIFLAIHSGRTDVQSVVLSVALTALSITLIAHSYFDKRNSKEEKKNSAVLLIAFMVVFFPVSGTLPLISDTGMHMIGAQRPNVTVILQGKDLEMARYLTGNKTQSVFKCDILFSEVGSTSLLVINSRRMVVNNENMALSF